MQQLLHVLAVDRDGQAALAAMQGAGWLLPIVICSERTRAASAILRWTERHGMSGDLIGQWLGRVAPCADTIDWLVVVRVAARPSSPSPPPLRWISLETLRSSALLLDYQQWAIAKVTRHAGPPAVAGPFGTMTWRDRVGAWIEEVTGAFLEGPVTIYRVGASEIVMGISTGSGPMYFKGLAPDRAREAHLTSTLSAIEPGAFARTRALTTQSDRSVWWLAEGCAGSLLTDDLSTQRVEIVAAAFARIQRRIMGFESVADLPCLDLLGAESWSIALLRGSETADVDGSCAAIERAWNEVSRRAVHSWVPMDLDPANVLIDGGGAVRFIDLDDSYRGPAPLAIATFARRVRRLNDAKRGGVISSDALYRAYERTWSWPSLTSRERQAFEVVSSVVEAHLGWQRVVRNVARGELFGALDTIAEQVARRLAHIVTPAIAGCSTHSKR